jgi:hypothetical protein
MLSFPRTAALALPLLCALTAAPACAQSGSVSSTLTDFQFELIDLAPNDGIAPAISIQESLWSRIWYDDPWLPSANQSRDAYGGTGLSTSGGAASTLHTPDTMVSKALVRTDAGRPVRFNGETETRWSFELTPSTAVRFDALALISSVPQPGVTFSSYASMRGDLRSLLDGTFVINSFSDGLYLAGGGGSHPLSGYLSSGLGGTQGTLSLATHVFADVRPVPEPHTWAMLFAGLAVLSRRVLRSCRHAPKLDRPMPRRRPALPMLALATLAALAAVPARAQDGSAASTITGFKFELIDLDLNDGITPAITFSPTYWARSTYGQPWAPIDMATRDSPGTTEVANAAGSASTTQGTEIWSSRATVNSDFAPGARFDAVMYSILSMTLTPRTEVRFEALAGIEHAAAPRTDYESYAVMTGELTTHLSTGSVSNRFYDSYGRETGSGQDLLLGYLRSGNGFAGGHLHLQTGARAILAPVPEPHTYAMLAAGLALLALQARRRDGPSHPPSP